MRRIISWLVRKKRALIHAYLYKEYDDNPFNVDIQKLDKGIYEMIARTARSEIDSSFIENIETDFGYLVDQIFVHDLALSTQITVKKSAPLYLHGYLLYGAIRQYLDVNPAVKSLNILETGTARGFSALVMAKALDDAHRQGRIITIDILPATRAIYWNCICDTEGKKTRLQLLDKWRQLIQNYVIFVNGYSDLLLKQIEVSRIHFAFVDGGHDYRTISAELSYIKERQLGGDILICDDYDKENFPDVVNAVNEVIASNDYASKIYNTATSRAYICCRRQ